MKGSSRSLNKSRVSKKVSRGHLVSFWGLKRDSSPSCIKSGLHLYIKLLLARATAPGMPKVRRSRKPPPEGWELIEPTLEELDQKMREGRAIRDPVEISGPIG